MRIGFTIVATVALLAALPFGAAAEEMITKKGLPLPPRSSGTGDGTAQDSGAKLYHPDDKRAVLPPRSSGTGDGTAQDSGAKLYHPDDKRAVLPPRSRR